VVVTGGEEATEVELSRGRREAEVMAKKVTKRVMAFIFVAEFWRELD
jgi:hypothetical protein